MQRSARLAWTQTTLLDRELDPDLAAAELGLAVCADVLDKRFLGAVGAACTEFVEQVAVLARDIVRGVVLRRIAQEVRARPGPPPARTCSR